MTIIVYADEKETTSFWNVRYYKRQNGWGISNRRMYKRQPTHLNVPVELHSVIPPNMLYADGRRATKNIWYETRRNALLQQSLGIPNGMFYTRHFICRLWRYTHSMLSWRLSRQATLPCALFQRIFHHVCLGNSKLPDMEEMTYQNIINYWKQCFGKRIFIY